MGCAGAPSTQPGRDASELRIGFAGANVEGSNLGLAQFATVLSLEGLVYNEVDGRPTPRLAERFTWSDDGLTLRIHLRPGVTFHDGTALTAPVAADMLRAVASDPGNHAQFPSLAHIREVTAVPPLDVVLHLSQPSGFLLEELGYLLNRGEQIGDQYVGTGPYRLVKRDPGELVFERFDAYYRGEPSIRRVTIVPFDTLRTAWSSLLRGDVDMVSDVPPEAVEFVRSSRVETFSFARGFQYMMGFNMKRPQLRSPRVRQALNMAVDRDALVQRVLRGFGTAATGPLWPRHWAYDASVQPFRFDPGAAASLLDQVGFPLGSAPAVDGRPAARIRFSCLIPSDHPVLERIGLVVQKQLYDVGVDVRFEMLDVTTFSQRIVRGEFDAILTDQISGPTLGRPYIFLKSGRTPNGLNVFGYENPEAESLFQTLSTSLNEAAIRSATQRLQRVLLEDPPAIFLAWSERIRVIRDDFNVFSEPDRDPLLTLWHWSPDKEIRAAVDQ